MELTLLDYKTFLVDDNGEKFIDLSKPTFAYLADVGIKRLYTVKEDEAMRPDKVASRVFGHTRYTDAILKINKIFNPFSLKEGTVLVIPNMDTENLHYRTPPDYKQSTSETNEVKKQFSSLCFPYTYLCIYFCSEYFKQEI